MFKVGDIVCVAYNRPNGDWNKSCATRGEVLRISTTVELRLIDPHPETPYETCWVWEDTVVPEDIYNSPLYQVMREE